MCYDLITYFIKEVDVVLKPMGDFTVHHFEALSLAFRRLPFQFFWSQKCPYLIRKVELGRIKLRAHLSANTHASY